MARTAGWLLAAVLVAAPAEAADLTSASFRLRGAGTAAGALPFAQAPGLSGSGLAVGQSAAAGASGAATTLATLVPGFWPIVAGALPSLDVDGDGRPAFLDADDDGDGLADTVETGTGVFVSPGDTGTSPVAFDSDGDGVSDGDEVAAGSDPNDPLSVPAPPVPALSRGALVLLFAAFALAAYERQRTRAATRRSST